MCFNVPFTWTKFQLNWSIYAFACYGRKCEVWESEEDKEIILNVCSHISQDWLVVFASNLVCRFT